MVVNTAPEVPKVFRCRAPYGFGMTMNDIRSSISAADGMAGGVHATHHGRGDLAELAAAIHLLCGAVRDLAAEVERTQRKIQ